MQTGNFTYAAILLASIAYPLAQSFEHRVQIYKKWKHFYPGLFITAGIFLIWDVYFAYHRVWSFNPEYVTGIWLLKLPLEEWLFFLVIPYCCFFLYCVLNYFIPEVRDHALMLPLHWAFTIFLFAGGMIHLGKIYTSVAFIGAATVMAILAVIPFFRSQLYRFYSTFFLSIIPFLIVNGILTSLPVVSYDDTENLGIRFGTIPAEDLVYLLMLLFMNLGVYVWLAGRAAAKPEGER